MGGKEMMVKRGLWTKRSGAEGRMTGNVIEFSINTRNT
jgi:hypothetical protein